MLPLSLVNEIRPYYEVQDPGHDWAHIQRVVTTATMLADKEAALKEVVIPAAFLHDIVNVPKNHSERARASTLAADKAIKLLEKHGADSQYFTRIHQAIVEHSFSRGLTPSSIESACVQDADRLDALGAIGVLRCTAVNVEMKAKFYDPEDPFADRRELDDKKWMLDHYEVKLLRLHETFTTAQGRREAQRRTDFMLSFLDQLRSEITA
jgi:uncharacterized protein